jgi:UDP-glucuronate decarboxylase
MNILITGGAGFIGSHLCRRLLNEGNFIICVDNFITGSKENIEDLLNPALSCPNSTLQFRKGGVNLPKFKLINHDISQPLYLDEDLDWVLHFASPASPKDYLEHPIKTIKVGTLGTHNCLGIAKSKKAKFFLASTSEIYGDPLVHPQPEEYHGNVNPIGPRSCFSFDTEVLTKDGWKMIKDVSKEDRILTLNQKGYYLEYQRPVEIIKERYIGEMIRFKNSKIDLLVTPNHDMYTRKREARNFAKIKAFESINWRKAEMLISGAEWFAEEKEYFYLPKVKNSKFGNIEKIKMDDWIEFFGYYITEGCAYIRNYKEKRKVKIYDRLGYNVLIAQDKEKSKSSHNKIKQCLDRLPFKYYFSGHQFLINNKQLTLYLKRFGRGKEKFIPAELKNLSKRQLKILFDALMLGDGNKQGTDFYSSSARLIGDFQEILLKLGMGGNVNIKDVRKKNPVYCIHILHNKKKDFLTPLYPERKIEKYDGYVYCVNVPNHIIYIRSKGKCLFCGNCYDEAKRAAEALSFAYHRQHNLNIKIVRIFNSILANEQVLVFNDGNLYLETIEKYVNNLERKKIITPFKTKEIFVPSLNFKNYKIELKRVKAVIKHNYEGDAYELKLSYGRQVNVTGDHSVFTINSNGDPEAVPVRKIKKGDYVAIAKRLPVLEKDIGAINLYEELIRNTDKLERLWDYVIYDKKLKSIIEQNKSKIYEILDCSGRFKAVRQKNEYFCIFNRYRKESFLPVYVLYRLCGMNVNLEDAKIRIGKAGAHIYSPNKIKITDDVLWLIGFFMAEGCSYFKKNKSAFISFCSEESLLRKARNILEKVFGVHVVFIRYGKYGKPASIYIHSKVLYFIFNKIFNILNINEKGMPSWIIQLPLQRLKFILEGYKDGDGTHSGKKVGNELCFDTKSKKVAHCLNMILLRFGIVASFGRYYTLFKKKYGNKKFSFYRLTVCNLSSFDILEWDKGVLQKLTAREMGDIVWAKIKSIKKRKSSEYVYDFSVPGTENFMAGNGVYCHNTYGPYMRLDDGRVVSNFIYQALTGKDITIYGDGSQTRSFCYVDDLIEGIVKFIQVDYPGPLNLGNPAEFTVIDLAKKIIALTNSKSKIKFLPLPEDDPKQRQPDISKAKKILNWQPKLSLDEGLKKTVEWFKKELNTHSRRKAK